MALEVSCPGCEGHFRVPDTAAGKKIRCPKCKGAIEVPQAATDSPMAPAATSSKAAKQAVTPPPSAGKQSIPAAKPQSRAEQWFLKTEEGDEYGPAPRGELEQWKAEGRITAECQLLLEGSVQWQWASQVFPDLDDEALAESEEPAPVATKTTQPAAKQPVKNQPQPLTDAGPPSSRSRLVAGLLGVFLGPLGIHRFYLGYWVIGLLMLVTGGGCGIWSLVDAVLVFVGRVNDADGRTLSP